MNGRVFLIPIVIVVAIFILAYRRIIRKQSFKSRKEMLLQEIYDKYVNNSGVKYETFLKVYNLLGNSYHINPKLLRPSDKLETFFKIDSWDLDAGTEKIEEWLFKTLNIKIPTPEIKTVLDLLIFVQKNIK